MMEVNLRPVSSSQDIMVKTTPMAKEELPSKEKIDSEIKAAGTKEIGEKALEKAISELSKLLEGRDVRVDTVFDVKTGQQQVSIKDSKTGKPISQVPPDAAVEMAEKSRYQHIGWMLDKLV